MYQPWWATNGDAQWSFLWTSESPPLHLFLCNQFELWIWSCRVFSDFQRPKSGIAGLSFLWCTNCGTSVFAHLHSSTTGHRHTPENYKEQCMLPWLSTSFLIPADQHTFFPIVSTRHHDEIVTMKACRKVLCNIPPSELTSPPLRSVCSGYSSWSTPCCFGSYTAGCYCTVVQQKGRYWNKSCGGVWGVPPLPLDSAVNKRETAELSQRC